MASGFSVPRPKRKIDDNSSDLPKFDWKNVEIEAKIGQGSYGTVVSAIYAKNHCKRQVVIKQPYDVAGNEKEFLKEARLLYGMLGQRNIVEFIAINTHAHQGQSFSLMQEFVSFSFRCFGEEKLVNSLSQFLSHIDQVYDFESFEHFPSFIVKDVIAGLNFLHASDVVHRDLKPANILVSNVHYGHFVGEEFERFWQSGEPPIICKLTDFGESRSRLIQTQTIVASRVNDLNRGTPAYMSPEILIPEKRTSDAAIDKLKTFDIWAFGMTCFMITNPSSAHPYCQEISTEKSRCPGKEAKEILQDLLRAGSPPRVAVKYEQLHASDWYDIFELHRRCNDFDCNRRVTTVQQIEEIIASSTAAIQCNVLNLEIYQGTALEAACKAAAERFIDGTVKEQVPVTLTNDGTNACAFLCLKICESLAHNVATDVEFENDVAFSKNLMQLTTDIVQTFPELINPFRESDKIYQPVNALSILREHQLTDTNMELFEELPFDYAVFSRQARENFEGKIVSLMIENESFCTVYTCEPYSMVIAYVGHRLILIDTHSIPVSCGGNGNAQIRIYGPGSEAAKAMCRWLWNRLKVAKIRNTGQSLSLVRFKGCKSDGKSVNVPLESYAELDDVVDLTTVDSDNDKVNEKRRKLDHIAEDRYSVKDLFEDGSTSSEDECDTGNDEILTPDVEYDCPNPDGKPYKDNPLTPVFCSMKKAFDAKSLVAILLNDYSPELLCIAPPTDVAHNVSFLIDLPKLVCRDDAKCDSMGAWTCTGSPKRHFVVRRNAENIVEEIKPTKELKTNSNGELYTLKRSYLINASDGDVHKTIVTLEDEMGNEMQKMLVHYVFENEEHELLVTRPHGNSKGKAMYKRMLSSTRNRMKLSVSAKDKRPQEILDQLYSSLGDVSGASNLDSLPRGPQDLYNARHQMKKASSILKGTRSEKAQHAGHSSADAIWMLMERAKREEEISRADTFIRECRIHPSLVIVLATNKQLKEIVQFCTGTVEFSVLSIDPTFNIFEENISLTVTTFQNLRLHQKATDKPPVFIGPLLIHQKKDWKTYSQFAHTLLTEQEELEGILACGTDGEKALIEGLKKNFKFATFLRCFLHVKDNIQRELTKRGVLSYAKKAFMNEIFGKQEQGTKFLGLVDCNSDDEFDSKLDALKQVWEEREGNASSASFYQWFKDVKAHDMKDSMLQSVRREAGLGDPPSEYTNNAAEAGNFMIKNSLNFEAKKPHEFIEEVKKIIELQFRNEERAVFGKGPYKIRSEFIHLVPPEVKWGKMNFNQRKRAVEKFLDAGMDAKKEFGTGDLQMEDFDATPTNADKKLSCTPEGSGITTVPFPILESLFQKANHLLSMPGYVMPQPGSTNGQYIVAGVGNKLHIVSRGKGKALSCDRNCVNRSTKLCEHVLAVAEKMGILDEFLMWFKRSKAGPKFTTMALQGGPKNAGKKPSARKKTNAKKPEVTNVIDMLGNEDLPPESSHGIQSTQSNTTSACPTSFFSQSNVNFAATPQVSMQDPIVINQRENTSPVNVANPQQLRQGQLIHGSPFLSAQQYSQPNTSPAFTLKWVIGTTVSKCYGCGRDIMNPPVASPDDLVLVCRDYREYRDRATGQKQITEYPQNIHFHLRAACLLSRYRGFNSSCLCVPNEFLPLLSRDHLERLYEEFGWMPFI